MASKLNETKPDLPPARDYNELPRGTFRDEWDEERILQQAAEIMLKRGTPEPEPEPIAPQSIKPGERLLIHVRDAFSRDGWRHDRHVRGEELTVTYDEINTLRWSDHRTGENTFDRMLAKGHFIAPGPWPAWEPVWTFGSDAWADARRAAVSQASQHTDPDRRAKAMAEIVQTFGESSFSPESAAKYYQRLYSHPEAHQAARERQGAAA